MENANISAENAALQAAFAAALSDHFGANVAPVADGKLHCFTNAEGARAWYVLFSSGYAAGWFGELGSHVLQVWGPPRPGNEAERLQKVERAGVVLAQLEAQTPSASAAQADTKRDALERPGTTAAAPKAPRKGAKK